MAKYQHEICKRCERYYNTADSDYCTEFAISEPTFTNIARLAGTTTHIALLALWVVTTKGYALFAKTHREL